jgi:anti-anti-sigma regulatory factor
LRSEPVDGLTLRVVPAPPGVLVMMMGELDLAHVGAVATVLDELCDGVTGDIELDLSELGFIGFQGVEMVRAVHRRLAVHDRRVSVRRSNEVVRRAFSFTGDPCPNHRNHPTSPNVQDA